MRRLSRRVAAVVTVALIGFGIFASPLAASAATPSAYCSANRTTTVWNQNINFVAYDAGYQYSPNSQVLRCQMQWSIFIREGYTGSINGGNFSEGGSVWQHVQSMLKDGGWMDSSAVSDGIVDSQMVKAMQKAGNAALCGGIGTEHSVNGTLDNATWKNFACYIGYVMTGEMT